MTAAPIATELGRSLGHLRSLDGLRAVAVLVVMAYHAGIAGFHGGRAGVDVFFVVSGFLITMLLLVEQERTGRVGLGAFYMRRALRLYPALLVATAGALALAYLKMPVFDASSASFDSTLDGTPFALFYTMNVARAAGWSSGGFLGHTWSLAIEEQFYLVWPVVVILVLRGRRPALLGWTALVCAVSSASLRAGLHVAGIDGELLYNATFSHVDGVFAGCALAVLWHCRPDLVARARHPAATAVAVLAAGAVMVHGQNMNTYGYLVVVVATLVILGDLLCHRSSPLSDGLSHPAAVAVGRRSYGLYLYHWPIFLFVGLGGGLVKLVLMFALTFVAAWISFAWIEHPFLRLKRRWSVIPTEGSDASRAGGSARTAH